MKIAAQFSVLFPLLLLASCRCPCSDPTADHYPPTPYDATTIAHTYIPTSQVPVALTLAITPPAPIDLPVRVAFENPATSLQAQFPVTFMVSSASQQSLSVPLDLDVRTAASSTTIPLALQVTSSPPQAVSLPVALDAHAAETSPVRIPAVIETITRTTAPVTLPLAVTPPRDQIPPSIPGQSAAETEKAPLSRQVVDAPHFFPIILLAGILGGGLRYGAMVGIVMSINRGKRGGDFANKSRLMTMVSQNGPLSPSGSHVAEVLHCAEDDEHPQGTAPVLRLGYFALPYLLWGVLAAFIAPTFLLLVGRPIDTGTSWLSLATYQLFGLCTLAAYLGPRFFSLATKRLEELLLRDLRRHEP